MRLCRSKLAAATTVALLILVSAQSCRAVRIGDEQYANDVGGVFYVFSDMAIHVVDPSNLTAVKVIREDQDGQPLSNEGANGGSASTSRSWNDAVLAQDSSRSLSYLFVNEGDVYPGPGNSTHSYVTIIDTNTQTIVARVSVSPRPVHIYAIDLTQEVWTHSDTDGTFDIFSVDSPSQLNTSNVPGLVADGGHGKLLVDEYLFPNSYATNVNEQFLHLLDLEDRVRLAAFDFSETIPDCAGTHSIVYSNISQHAYVECVNGGVFEWDTVTNKLVHFFANVTGYVTAALGDDWIVAADGPNNIATLLQPQGNGERSRIAYSVSIPGNPQHPVFYSNASSGRAEGLSSYTMFFPLADDTNLANLATGADVSSSEYLAAPSDCTYAASSSNSDTGRSLATGSNGQAVTPDCGACAAGFSPFDASLFNASASGMRYITLPAIEGNASRGLIGNSTFLSAGASKPTVANSSDANECSFGETYRTGKRGGQYIGLTADIPYSALFIIDASAAGGPTVVGTVNTSSNPSTLSWVPNNPPADDDTILGSY